MHIYIYIYIYIHTYIHIYIYIHLHLHACGVCIHVLFCACVVFACMSKCIKPTTCKHTHTRTKLIHNTHVTCMPCALVCATRKDLVEHEQNIYLQACYNTYLTITCMITYTYTYIYMHSQRRMLLAQAPCDVQAPASRLHGGFIIGISSDCFSKSKVPGPYSRVLVALQHQYSGQNCVGVQVEQRCVCVYACVYCIFCLCMCVCTCECMYYMYVCACFECTLQIVCTCYR